MGLAENTQALNRLLGLLCRSFPQYVRWSRPHIPPGRSDVLETIEAIVDDQDGLAERVSQAIYDLGALPHTGEFPMEFTDSHDLDIDFVLNLAAHYQEQDVEAIAAIAESLQTLPSARALTEEALGMAKGHLESLRELLTSPAAG